MAFFPWSCCDELQIPNSNLSITNSNFATTLYGSSTEYNSLIKLDIRNTPMDKKIIRRILQGLSHKELTMRKCSLHELPDNSKKFNDLIRELIKLHHSHN